MEKLLSVEQYAKKYNLKRSTVYYNLGKKDGIIPRENVKVITKEVVGIKDEPPRQK